MATMLLLVALGAEQSPDRHIRASEPKIIALMSAGLARSATFRRLVETLDRSDVIVYVEPKLTRQALGGYLTHNVMSAGGYRYLRVTIDVGGPNGRLVPLLGHELQHAVEVSQDPDARDPAGLERLFRRSALAFGCASSTCLETQAAKDVEATVRMEMKEPSGSTIPLAPLPQLHPQHPVHVKEISPEGQGRPKPKSPQFHGVLR